MQGPLAWLGSWLARYLAKRIHVHGTAPAVPPERLLAHLRPGDVLLVEGDTRVSSAIKYLTQSTWSHAALYVGRHLVERGGNPAHLFVDADTIAGVRSVGIDDFNGMHTRICRPVGLSEEDCRTLTGYVIDRIGHQYDLHNVIDLARYLFPTPPVPLSMRRRMIALGSGDPTRAICSTLIAQAFQSIRYPILPAIGRRDSSSSDCPGCIDEIYHIRHHSLFAPRDFDISPYFRVIKPTAEDDFEFRNLHWEDPAAT